MPQDLLGKQVAFKNLKLHCRNFYEWATYGLNYSYLKKKSNDKAYLAVLLSLNYLENSPVIPSKSPVEPSVRTIFEKWNLAIPRKSVISVRVHRAQDKKVADFPKFWGISQMRGPMTVMIIHMISGNPRAGTRGGNVDSPFSTSLADKLKTWPFTLFPNFATQSLSMLNETGFLKNNLWSIYYIHYDSCGYLSFHTWSCGETSLTLFKNLVTV